MLRKFLLVAFLLVATLATALVVVAWNHLRVWDTVVTERFRTHRWSFPSKIYSDATLIYPGLDLKAVGFFDRLRDLGYRQVDDRVQQQGEYRCDADSACDLFLHEPLPGAAKPIRHIRFEVSSGNVSRIADVDSGAEVFSFELEPAVITGLYEGVWEERHLVALPDVPPLLIRAIIDTEDQRFYQHRGVDVVGVLRALWVNATKRRLVQGGSTLTQQLMKNFFLTDARNLRRKLREAVMALIVEHRFSKEEILENYLNEIYLGQRGAQGIYGVWEASRFYFAKAPHELSIAEMALLAGLIRGPNYYSPFRDAERALHRRNIVLTVMREQGDIDQVQYDAAIQERLRLAPIPTKAKDAPYFVDFVRKELADLYPADLLTSEGMLIFTSLDMHLQRLAEQTLQDGLAQLEKRYPRLHADDPADQLQACLIVVQPQTGAIKAMMGGRDYRFTQFNRCTQALRQPGSVFKPFTYLAAFEKTRHSDHPINPATHVEDEPFTWEYEKRSWTPSNYKRHYMGMVSVRQALEHSLNAATARIAYDVGLDSILETARRLGITTPLPSYPSVILGSAEVAPFEVAQAFAALANGGLRAQPLSIKRVLDRSGVPLDRRPVEVEQAVPADTAYLVTHLLEGVLDHGTAAAARRLGFRRPAAGKTGTTNDYRDAWFVGFTPDLLAVVWVGFDQKRPLNLAGGEAALPIWTAFMKEATAGMPQGEFIPPPGVSIVKIDPVSGQLATSGCPESIEESFYSDQAPTVPCALHPGGNDLPTGLVPQA
ncbi:MAG: PBP1A family penicillin-binding protein [Deltaproteobacteria bacterium]|nr:PBP1A family penicillin-binding protein [Deltaproteobacteria bacterium]